MESISRTLFLCITLATFTFQTAIAQPASALLSEAKNAMSADVTVENRSNLFVILSKLAETDETSSHLISGAIYEQGVWAPLDMQKAFAHYESAHEAGSWLGSINLMRLLSEKHQPFYDLDRAVVIGIETRSSIGKAANSGKITRAEQFQLRNQILDPILASIAMEKAVFHAAREEYKEAFPFYRAASMSGVQQATLAVAYMYREGRGVKASEDWEKAYFVRATQCSPEKIATMGWSQELCDHAADEYYSTTRRISEREIADKAAVLAIIGLGVLAIALAAGGGTTSSYQPPNIDHNPGLQMAAELAWLGKW